MRCTKTIKVVTECESKPKHHRKPKPKKVSLLHRLNSLKRQVSRFVRLVRRRLASLRHTIRLLNHRVARLSSEVNALQNEVGAMNGEARQNASFFQQFVGRSVTLQTSVGNFFGTVTSVGSDFVEVREPSGDTLLIPFCSVEAVM